MFSIKSADFSQSKITQKRSPVFNTKVFFFKGSSLKKRNTGVTLSKGPIAKKKNSLLSVGVGTNFKKYYNISLFSRTSLLSFFNKSSSHVKGSRGVFFFLFVPL